MCLVFYLLMMLVVMGMVFWVYCENYCMQVVLQDMIYMQCQIGSLCEDLGVLWVEWVFLNCFDCLWELINMNFDKLKLVFFILDQFVEVGQVVFLLFKVLVFNFVGIDLVFLFIECFVGFLFIRLQERML